MIQHIKNLLKNYSNVKVDNLNIKERGKYNLVKSFYTLEKDIINNYDSERKTLNAVKNVRESNINFNANNYTKNLNLYLKYNGLYNTKARIDRTREIEQNRRAKLNQVYQNTSNKLVELEKNYQAKLDQNYNDYTLTTKRKRYLEQLDENRVAHRIDDYTFSIQGKNYTIDKEVDNNIIDEPNFIESVRSQGFYSTTDKDIPNGLYVTTSGFLKKKQTYIFVDGKWYSVK